MRFYVFVGCVLIFCIFGFVGCETTKAIESPTTTPVEKPVKPAAPIPDDTGKPVPPPAEGEIGILSAEKTEYDFGTIEPGSRNSGEFILKNTGKGVLEIDKNIHCSCGCTLASLETYTLGPGKTTKMKVTYNAGETPGSTSKYCTVKPMPPAKGELRLVIKANVKKHVNVTPEEIVVPLKPEGDATQILVVEGADERPFKISRVTVTNDAFTMEFDPHASQVRHEIKVTPKMDVLGASSSSGAFTFFLDHPVVKRTHARFTVQMPFQAQPATIFFRDMKPKSPSQATITIVSEFGDKVEVTDVTTEKDLVKIISKEAKTDSYTVTVELTAPADNKTKILRDRVIFTFNNPYQQDIKVPVYGRVKY
ncbi:MAG: DUF1573 domain-containing protein [Sedimentisphaerales bacterium]|nr:DUF1573 domain-containing protein [Sedimentisphaerales bacterium]